VAKAKTTKTTKNTRAVALEWGRRGNTRPGRVLIGGHFVPEIQTALKLIALEERVTMQAIVAEALAMFLRANGKTALVPLLTDLGEEK
jgi:hypothetical protein